MITIDLALQIVKNSIGALVTMRRLRFWTRAGHGYRVSTVFFRALDIVSNGLSPLALILVGTVLILISESLMDAVQPLRLPPPLRTSLPLTLRRWRARRIHSTSHSSGAQLGGATLHR